MKKIAVFVTIGPSSNNKDFLKYVSGKVSLVRLNMSHVKLIDLEKNIKKIKKFTKVPICIDTEGAQIRTKLTGTKSINYLKGKSLSIGKKKGKLKLYPQEVFEKLKKGDILDVGFEGLKLKVTKKTLTKIHAKCLNTGILENNKGVHIENRNIKLNFITEKDLNAIKIAKKHKIKNFALSFTNSSSDITKFNNLLPKENKFFKIETKNAIKNLNLLFKKGRNFLIDRGDLSKDIGIKNVPVVQRKIFKIKNKFKNKINVVIATNFLESMIEKPFPTRAEVNDIYNALEMGANGLVLAGETAMGKYPKECIKLLKEIIDVFKKNEK